MNLRRFYKEYSTLNIFILLVFLLLGFSFFYFFYSRQKKSKEIFVKVHLVSQKDLSITAPYDWIQDWIGQAVIVGDQEGSSFSASYAEILEKEVLEGRYNGQFINLLMKVKVIEDRSGLYLYKNRPLVIGTVLNLKFPRVNVYGLVTYISEKLPEYKWNRLTITIRDRQVNAWVADSLKVGSSIVNSKGQVIAKVVEKKVLPADSIATLSLDEVVRRSTVTYDRTKRDLEVTLEILASKINDNYYFFDTQKIKVNGLVFFPFKEVLLDDFTVTSIVKIEEVTQF